LLLATVATPRSKAKHPVPVTLSAVADRFFTRAWRLAAVVAIATTATEANSGR
jgi:hypothetical protein